MESIKKISEYVAQLRRVGKGHGKELSLEQSSSFAVLFVNFKCLFFILFLNRFAFSLNYQECGISTRCSSMEKQQLHNNEAILLDVLFIRAFHAVFIFLTLAFV